MAHNYLYNPPTISSKKLLKPKLTAFIILISLLVISINYSPHFTQIYFGFVSGESGAPPENGTTTQTWYSDFDNITRTNENFTTKDIIINGTGSMTWKNITAEVSGDINVKTGGFFNLTNCCVILTGNLIISGELNLINSSILVNSSTNGEFFIAVETGAAFNSTAGSNITSFNQTNRIRIIYVAPNSIFEAENTSFSYIGSSFKFKGLKLDANNTYLKNCEFYNCTNAVTLNDNHNCVIENCEFFNNTIGLNITNSNNNLIKNCSFYSNIIGLLGENSGSNIIEYSTFKNNSNQCLQLFNESNDNIIKKSIFENNQNIGILFNYSSSNNHLIGCSIINNTGPGVKCASVSTNTVLKDCYLGNNSYNLICINNTKLVKLENCTLSNPSLYDIFLENSSKVTTLNTTFNRSLVQVDQNSNLTVLWYLHIIVQNVTSKPISDVNISIWDSNDVAVLFTKTDSNGQLMWLILTEFYETNHTRLNLSPYEVQIWKAGYDIINTKVYLNKSQLIIIKTNLTVELAPDLVPTDIIFSDNYPHRNDSVTITVKIENFGNDDYNTIITNVTVQFFVDNILINISTDLPSIPTDSEIYVAINWIVNVTNGSHKIKIIIDPDGNISELNKDNNSINKDIIINSIPIAFLDIDRDHALTYEQIFLDARRSYNRVQELPVGWYFYEFGDGNNSGWVTNSTLLYEYINDGSYTIIVKVRDASGQNSSWSNAYTVIIENRKPIADFTMLPSSGYITTDFLFDPGLSTDKDGVVVSYYWEFSVGANITNSTELKPQVKFSDDIEYNVSLTIWDNDEAVSDIKTKTIKIQNLPPVVRFEISPETPHVNEPVTFNSTGSYDFDDTSDTFDYFWDFDDGTFEYDLEIVSHNFSEPRIYNVTLYIYDDDRGTGLYWVEINVTKAPEEDSKDGKGNGDLFWVAVLVGLVLSIFLVLIMLVFITQSRKLRKQIQPSAKAGAGDTGEEITTGEFTTAGKLDFVIVKKAIGKRYIKFELHKTTKSPNKFVGIIWKSAFLDSSWQVKDKMLGAKDKVIDYLQLKIIAQTSKDWVIDYKGNGLLLSKEYLDQIQPTVKSNNKTPTETTTSKSETSLEKSSTTRQDDK